MGVQGVLLDQGRNWIVLGKGAWEVWIMVIPE
jgi:hypothetical protein